MHNYKDNNNVIIKIDDRFFFAFNSTVETFIVNVVKIGWKVAAEYNKIDFDQVSER